LEADTVQQFIKVEKAPAVTANLHCKNGFIFDKIKVDWGDGSHRVTILCFWSAH
jgi:hypothetical protein